MRLSKLLQTIIHDQRGMALSSELVVVCVILTIGVLGGIVAIRDAVVSEATDVANVMQDLQQSVIVNGSSSASSSVGGFDFQDLTDSDEPNADPVSAVNGTSFANRFSLSGYGTLNIQTADPATETVTGTIGDASVSTDFTITTDTGQVRGSSVYGASLSESPFDDGRFTLEFADALTDIELFISSLSGATNTNLVGDFTITLSDGTVLENASFEVLPDDFNGLGSHGMFGSFVHVRERVTSIDVGGIHYIVDPTNNGRNSQAAGRLVFDGIPNVSSPPAPNAVGVSSISFYRSGGDVDGFGFTLNVSGKVMKAN